MSTDFRDRPSFALYADLIDVAQARFGLYTSSQRGRLNANYVEMVARATLGRLSQNTDHPRNGRDGPISQFVDPTLFIAGDSRLPELSFSGEKAAAAPCVTFVVGQYGMGKTELAFRVSHSLQALGPTAALALPINLGLCRSGRTLLRDGMPAAEFRTLIFDNLLSKDACSDDAVAGVLDGMRTGDVLLFLDGLDELIATAAQLTQFVHGLASLITNDGLYQTTTLKCRVIVSVRHELLSAITKSDASDLVETLRQAGLPPEVFVYFLELGPLNNSHVRAYIANRLPHGDKVEHLVLSNDQVLEMLRRPLLLRIFCDLADRSDVDLVALVERLAHASGPGRLLTTFVDNAASDANLKKDQSSLTPLRWDTNRLAFKSLELYEHGNRGLTVLDVRQILVSDEGPDVPSTLPSHEILKGIHKCPFLVYDEGRSYDDPHSRIAFAHLVFFEYFVALGMYLRSAAGDLSVFDELVLNVDMRKFLREFIQGDQSRQMWYDQTRRSYALETPERAEWSGGLHDFALLDRQRSLLLDSMTEPELYIRNASERDRLTSTIDWFLANERTFHPRYLTYNYEAVAVYVRHQESTQHGVAVRRRFKTLLYDRVGEVVEKLSQDAVPLREAWELLLERILSVALRLRYKWAKDDRGVLMAIQHVRAPATKSRIESTLADISRAVF